MFYKMITKKRDEWFAGDCVVKELIEYIEKTNQISIDATANSGEWHSDSEIKIDKLGYVIVNGTKTKEFWDGTIKCEKKPLRIKIRNICGDESILEV